ASPRSRRIVCDSSTRASSDKSPPTATSRSRISRGTSRRPLTSLPRSLLNDIFSSEPPRIRGGVGRQVVAACRHDALPPAEERSLELALLRAQQQGDLVRLREAQVVQAHVVAAKEFTVQAARLTSLRRTSATKIGMKMPPADQLLAAAACLDVGLCRR